MPLERRPAFIGEFFFQRALGPAFRPPHMGPGGIPENAVQPGGEPRTTLELTEIPEGKKQSLLHNVFAVLVIAKHLSGSSLKSRHAGCEEFVQLSGIHIDRENERSVDLRAGIALLFNSQVASLGVTAEMLIASRKLDCKNESNRWLRFQSINICPSGRRNRVRQACNSKKIKTATEYISFRAWVECGNQYRRSLTGAFGRFVYRACSLHAQIQAREGKVFTCCFAN
jgi:hypothetical protein